MSAEACRKQASRLWLQAPEWLQDMNFLAANIWIGRTKYAYISWYPGQNQWFLLPHDSLESELQPGLVHLDGHIFTLRKVRCPGTFSSEKHLGARKALGLLRSLSSNLRSEVTSEAMWRSLWPRRPLKRLFKLRYMQDTHEVACIKSKVKSDLHGLWGCLEAAMASEATLISVLVD